MCKHKYMKYKPRWNSIPTYLEFDFDASLNNKPLEHYTSMSKNEFDKLDPKLKKNIEFTVWAKKREVYGLYNYGYLKDKLTLRDHIVNYLNGQVFMWIIVPVIGWLSISYVLIVMLEFLGF